MTTDEHQAAMNANGRAEARAAGSAEADQARALLAAMPPDPDVEWHRILLRTALQ